MDDPNIRVVIADDEPAMREALADVIDSAPELTLVDQATDHPGALRAAVSHRPDVLVLDFRMPGGNGPGTMRAVRGKAPGTAVLVLSAYEDPDIVVDMLVAGAAGYLVKGTSAEELLEAINRVARGQLSMPTLLAAHGVRTLRSDLADSRRTEARYRRLFEAGPDAMVVVDEAGIIELVNEQAEEVFGYSQHDLLGDSIDVVLPDLPPAISEWAEEQAAIEHPSMRTVELTARRSDGSDFATEVGLTMVPTEEGHRVVVRVRDITQTKRSRAVLEDSVALLRKTGQEHRAVLSALVSAQEQERRRIAAGIHDDTMQVITAAGLRLQQLRRRLHEPDDVAVIEKLQQTITQAVERLRQLIFEFRPPALDLEGLAAALRAYLEQVHVETGLSYQVDDRLSAEPPENMRVLVYRIAQEALMNVRKHARATRVRVQLLDVDGGYLVKISDNGVGYSPLGTESRPGHLGLTLMRERVEIAGGWCRIESSPGAGTTVEFWVPRGRDTDDGVPAGAEPSPPTSPPTRPPRQRPPPPIPLQPGGDR